MLLGAQLYSLRDKTTTEEGFRETFRSMKEAGYESVQLSGGKACDPHFFADLAEEYALPINSTHTAFDRIVNDTDRVIEEHRIFGSREVGIGALPAEYRDSVENLQKFIEIMREPVRKIRAAGLDFGYHNHHFEFFPLGDSCIYEYLINNTDWHFIVDVYWLAYAHVDPVSMMERRGHRVVNFHLKDMDATEDRGITACGTGSIDFKPIIAVAEKIGVKNAFIEQDNAPDLGDSFGQMRLGAEMMLPQVHHA